ncbi:helix-turn-helix domain-containing protein [Flexibacterium corallicola]|uniref:helix-turn-helix domain-containing protein n=1 Tax=Flexibacterium corallicola TaxID=3037259 RepID=UPI00286F6163|nr:helix-turn-helix domain-containing protein [Pseudovibrio sp. M1P-2-3]
MAHSTLNKDPQKSQHRCLHVRSKLTRYQSQILMMVAQGNSQKDIQAWLKAHKLAVCPSTLSHWIKHHG